MEWLKPLHISCVVLSFCGFFVRGVWMLRSSAWLQNKWTKILPHIIDTGLLLSALLMLYVMQWSVIDLPWLQVKIVALLVYIGLGAMALKPGRSMKFRFAAWILGLFVFLFIVSVAISKSVYGFLNFSYVF